MKCSKCEDSGLVPFTMENHKREHLYCTCDKGQKVKDKADRKNDTSGSLTRIYRKRIARYIFIIMLLIAFIGGVVYFGISYGARLMD